MKEQIPIQLSCTRRNIQLSVVNVSCKFVTCNSLGVAALDLTMDSGSGSNKLDSDHNCVLNKNDHNLID